MKEQKKKERLDVLLVKRVLAESREKAKAIIMTGNVFVNDQREDKAGSTFPIDCKIEIKGTPMKYVSRGGCYKTVPPRSMQSMLEQTSLRGNSDRMTVLFQWKRQISVM